MKTLKRKIGDIGEDIVVKYLKKHKYKILQRNYETNYGEIDIIAKNKEYLCFIEVKTRAEDSLFSPLSAITKKEIDCIIKSAYVYLSKNNCSEIMPRFDVAEVTYDKDNKFNVNYIENAFEV